MRKMMNITKALADANRVRVLMILKKGELCVCQIVAVLGLAPSTVSKHMAILKQADLVESDKCGRWIYYRLADDAANKAVREILEWLDANLREDETVEKDLEYLREILKLDRETLCHDDRRPNP